MADTQSEQSRGLQQSELPTDIGTGSKPTHLDLFSGIGGFALAAQWAGFRTIAFIEIDKYCQKVLAKNFGALADANSGECSGKDDEIRAGRNSVNVGHPPIIHDIRNLNGLIFRGVDLITGGFPCQPFSVAGKRRGKDDDRAIWPEMFRVISEARPAWVLGENVPGIIPMELDNVLADLEGIGYATRAFVIPACAVEARHRRDRLWIVGRNISDPQRHGSSSGAGRGSTITPEPIRSSPCCWYDEREWSIKSGMGRVAHGIPSRVDRLKGLGNAIVPQVAYEILREIRALI